MLVVYSGHYARPLLLAVCQNCWQLADTSSET
jgi:hypothetical protein